LKRSNADKRKAVNLLLRDDEWAAKSDRWIAEKCGVHHQLVARLRNPQLDDSSSSRTGRDGKIRKQPKRRKRSSPKHVPPVSSNTLDIRVEF